MNLVRIAPKLYISGFREAKHRKDFYRICVSDSRREARFANSHYPINENDLPETFIRYARHIAAETIRQIEQGKRVLIYCHAGRNRSVSCCLYILCKYSDLNLREALHRIRRLHPDEAIMIEIMNFLKYRFNPRREEIKKEERRKKELERKKVEKRRKAKKPEEKKPEGLPNNQMDKLAPGRVNDPQIIHVNLSGKHHRQKRSNKNARYDPDITYQRKY